MQWSIVICKCFVVLYWGHQNQVFCETMVFIGGGFRGAPYSATPAQFPSFSCSFDKNVCTCWRWSGRRVDQSVPIKIFSIHPIGQLDFRSTSNKYDQWPNYYLAPPPLVPHPPLENPGSATEYLSFIISLKHWSDLIDLTVFSRIILRRPFVGSRKNISSCLE